MAYFCDGFSCFFGILPHFRKKEEIGRCGPLWSVRVLSFPLPAAFCFWATCFKFTKKINVRISLLFSPRFSFTFQKYLWFMFGFKKKPNNSQNYNFNFMNIFSLLACINSYTIFSLSYLHATIPTFSKTILLNVKSKIIKQNLLIWHL